MKKLIYILFVAVAACSQNDNPSYLDVEWNTIKVKYEVYRQMCGSISDAVQYPAPWTDEVSKTFVIPGETIRSMSTCGLLESYITRPDRVLGPWCGVCSYSGYPGVTDFNQTVNNDPVVVELFGRDDCVAVLATMYLSLIERNKEKTGQEQCFEMLLASDVCIAVLDNDERYQFMVMALKAIENNKGPVREPRHIMVAIMKACNYAPFLAEADTEKYAAFDDGTLRTGLSENTWGYDICNFDIVEIYAKRFINEKNKK